MAKNNDKGFIEYILETNPYTQKIIQALNLIDKDIVEQSKRTVGGAATDVGQESLQLANLIADKTGIYEFDDEMHEKQQKFLQKTGNTLFGEDSITIDDRGGKNIIKVKEPTYFGGETARDITALLGSVAFGTKGVGAIDNLAAKTLSGKQLSSAVSDVSKLRKSSRFLLGAAAGEQVGLNPYEVRIANVIGEMTQGDDGKLQEVLDFLKADKNKTEAEARMGLLAEGFIINSAFPVVYYGGKNIFNALKDKDSVIKTLKDLATNVKEGKLDLSAFSEIARDASTNFGTKAPKLQSQADEDIDKLWQFSSNKLKRTIATLGVRGKDEGIGLQDFFRPRGYMTPKMFRIFNEQQAAKNAWVDATENFTVRLNDRIRKITLETDKYGTKDELGLKIQQALTSADDSILKELPDEIRTDVLGARQLLDDFSEMFLQMPNRTISKQTKETINENMGQWLRTSYEIFESPILAKRKAKAFEKYAEGKKFILPFKNKELEYYVDEFDNAVKYFKDVLKDKSKYRKASDERLTQVAKSRIAEILKSPDDAVDYFGKLDKFYGNNKDIFKRKQNIDKPIRDLLGEIKDPSANLFNSISRVTSFVEDNKFLEEAYNLGKGTINRNGEKVNGYFFRDAVNDPNTGIKYDTKIEGSQYGVLNGKYTTKEMAQMFTARNSLIGDLDKTTWYKTFLLAKGYGQASKTVLNHVTHARNTIGGAWFMLANGRNPLSKNFNKGIQAIYNKRFKEVGEQESLDYYNKLISLDVVNSGVKFGDVQSLLKDVSDTGAAKFLKDFSDKTILKPIKNLGKVAQDMYVAEDDIFKILSFEKELDTLVKASQKANVKMTDDYLRQLEKEAALITRNTLPTYSLVPRGIKQLRSLPFGNFFSFPAEMVRTTGNIVYQGLKEITSNNSVIALRGAQRLAGFGIAGLGGAEGLSELTKHIHGITDDEEKALRHLNKNTFSKNSKFLYHRNENGDLYINDISFVDPYDVVKRPFQTAIYQYLDGQRTSERLEKIMGDALVEAVSEFTSPFTEQALLTGKITSLIFKNGRNSDGFPISGWIREPMNFSDRLNNTIIGIKEIGQTFIPGGAAQIPQSVKAFTGKESDMLNLITGGKVGDKEYEPATSVLANLGIRYEKVDWKKNLESQAKLYNYTSREIDRIFEGKGLSGKPDGLRTGTDFLNAYLDANKRHYYAYKKLKLAYDAVDILTKNTLNIDKNKILEDNNISLSLRTKLQFNKYVPYFDDISSLDNKLQTFSKENQQYDISKDALRYYIIQSNEMFRKLPMLDIKFSDDDLLEEEIEFIRNPPSNGAEKVKERILKSEGGLIEGPDVPFTKENPADRVDPFTGEPYQEQMSRLGFGNEQRIM